MNITEKQRWTILQLWGAVCAERGWKTSDRVLRLETIGGIVGRELTSLNELERLAECTKVMNELKAMLGSDLDAGLEAVYPARNRQRNDRWLIEREILPCLALYPEESPMGLPGARAYLLEVMVDKSRWRKTDRSESEPTLADFNERTVKQILWTLSARLNEKRKAAGHSGHEMKMAAGVRCECALCRRMAPLVPLMVAEAEAEELHHQHTHHDDDNEPF